MKDGLGREIEYMRVSITDRCDLRCRYCMPEGCEKVSMSKILTYEDIVRICRVASDLGISRIKITGGEPFVRMGGTGFSKRDRTPEATAQVCDRMTPGIAEAIRAYSMTKTPTAMLSRATAGMRNETLIINLPGSPKAVRECLEFVLKPLKHGLEIMLGRDGECARN